MMKLRPPIVVILGHVDHGKTTLLDYIRTTNVAVREAGGITQKIGATSATTKDGKKITFIDTPGHAAFSSMRSRGAKVADIAVLVVAADDGVKPQTKEALEHILAAKIPFIVAATKIDLPTASLETVKRQMGKEGVLLEGMGGETPLIGVSGKTGKGVEELLEMIILLGELNDVSGDADGNLEAVVIEVGKSKAGPTVSILVRNGKLVIGDQISSDTQKAKVRGLMDYMEKPIKEVFPGEAALVLGFENFPEIGSRLWRVSEKADLVSLNKARVVRPPSNEFGKSTLIIKAKSAGSLEAIISNLPKDVLVLATGVGDVNESDVFLAKSTDARIVAFEGKIPGSIKKLAENEGVKVETFEVIYKLFEWVEEYLKKGRIEIVGKAEISATFPYENKKVAGCRITLGGLSVGQKVVLKRADQVLGEVKIISMKKGKTDIQKALQGEECGIIFVPQLDFVIGDVLISERK